MTIGSVQHNFSFSHVSTATSCQQENKPSKQCNDNAQNEKEHDQIKELAATDRKVRAHEAAHQATAGQYAQGGASFTFERGPDGVLYAVGGEVNVDTAPVPGDPEATLVKAQTIQRAALAPSDPSAQDRSVASKAAQMAAQARTEINNKNLNDEQSSTQIACGINEYKNTLKADQINFKTNSIDLTL